MQADGSAEHFVDNFRRVCNKLLDRVLVGAESHVNSLEAGRNTVSQYRTVLWLWHRLNQERLSESQLAMRFKPSGKGRTASMKMEVDHTISYSSWCELVDNEIQHEQAVSVYVYEEPFEPAPKGFASRTEAINFINKLGNCSLLHTNFNRSKNSGICGSSCRRFKSLRMTPLGKNAGKRLLQCRQSSRK